MNPVKASLRYPQVTLIVTLMLFGLGLYSLATMPRREDPKITIHTGIVAAIYPGATAEELEQQVTQKIEERLFRFAEVRKEKTFSTSRDGIVVINVELEPFVKTTDTFWSKLRLELAQLKQTDLPEGVRGPIVDSDFGDTVAVLLAVHGHDYGYRELKEYAQRVEAQLRTIRAVSKVRRIGEQKEEIEISSSLERLSQYAVNPLKIIGALQGRNTVQFAGRVPTEQGKVPIQTSGLFQTEEQIRRVMIDVSPTGQPVYLGDLAKVERIYKDPDQYARLNSERTILLAVEMQEGKNIVDFGQELRGKIDALRPMLPPDLKLDLIADQPTVVKTRINDFIREFGIAIVAVILVTIVLLPLRVAIISAIAIPVTISITFGLLNAFGIELHQVSISALIVVLGMVVDDAIVIADNYVELLDRKTPPDEAAWRSASELAVPVLTATLTIIGSFLPLLMLSGAVGEFIRALPITVAIALGTSYVVAMLLTPLLSRFFIRQGLHDHSAETPKKRRFSPLDLMQRSYAGSIGIFMRVPWLVLGGAVLAVGGGLLLLHFVPEQFFPSAERNQFVVDVWMPEGSRIEATDAAVRRMEKELKRDELVADYASFLGVSAPRFYYNVSPQPPAANYAQILVNTKAEKETPELVFKLRERLSGAAPEARVLVKELQQGNVVEAPVEVRITGPDAAELRTFGGKAAEILRQVPGAIYVHNDWHEASYQLRVSVREETANRLGLTNASIARQLAGGFEGAPVTTYWEGDRDVSVILRIEQERRETFEDVGDSYVTSTLTGARVPLRSVADFKPVWSESRIVRRNGVRTLTVRAFADEHHLPSQVLKAAMGKVASLPLPPGYRIEYGGEIENQRETFAEMVHALEISLIAIFLILLFQFRSLSDPLIVMASIPLALPGAALGLFVTRNPFGFTAFMGIVSLGGVVVRNAIILIDYIHARMREGAPLEEAAKEAGERRLRPIFLTTMAAAVGVTPMILSGSSLWSPLASAIAFGLVVSMFFTLVAIPVLFVVVHRRERVRATVPVTAVLGLLLLAVLPAGAAEPRRLTLEEATALAVKQNSTVKLANFKVKEAESRVGAARSNYYPQLRNDSAFVRLGEQQEVDLPRGALGVYPGLGPIPPVTVPFVLAENNLVISSTTVTQPVTHLFKIRDGVRAANAEAGIARSDVRRAEVEIALKVKELYYGILVTGERRRALGLQIAAGEEKLREARDAVETGNALQYKVLEGEAQIAQARQGLQTLDDTLADLALEFDELLGLPLDTQVELVRPEASSEAPAAEDGLLKTALERNPEILAAAQMLEKAKAAVSAARAEYIPEVGVFAQWVYQQGVPLVAPNIGAVGVKMSWNIWDWNKRKNGVRERETQLAEAEENLRRIRNRVQIDLEKDLRKVRRSDAAVNAAHASVTARAEVRRVAGDQVETGMVTASALKEAEGALAGAQADLLQAELNQRLAAAELKRTAGGR